MLTWVSLCAIAGSCEMQTWFTCLRLAAQWFRVWITIAWHRWRGPATSGSRDYTPESADYTCYASKYNTCHWIYMYVKFSLIYGTYILRYICWIWIDTLYTPLDLRISQNRGLRDLRYFNVSKLAIFKLLCSEHVAFTMHSFIRIFPVVSYFSLLIFSPHPVQHFRRQKLLHLYSIWKPSDENSNVWGDWRQQKYNLINWWIDWK